MKMQRVKQFVLIAAVTAATVSCGDVVRDGRSPVYLVIDSLVAKRGGADDPEAGTLLSDVLTKGSTFNDSGTVTLRMSPKKPIAVPPYIRLRDSVGMFQYSTLD
jgi:hypothetical protein